MPTIPVPPGPPIVGDIKFTVVTDKLMGFADTNFGIQLFAFNVDQALLPITAANIVGLPSGWSLMFPGSGMGQVDGFGRFDVVVDGTGSDRVDPLMFFFRGTGADAHSFAVFSMETADQGRVFFAAHVAGFDETPTGGVGSAFYGGPPVPIPATVWLMGSGLVALGAFARRRRLRITARPPE